MRAGVNSLVQDSRVLFTKMTGIADDFLIIYGHEVIVSRVDELEEQARAHLEVKEKDFAKKVVLRKKLIEENRAKEHKMKKDALAKAKEKAMEAKGKGGKGKGKGKHGKGVGGKWGQEHPYGKAGTQGHPYMVGKAGTQGKGFGKMQILGGSSVGKGGVVVPPAPLPDGPVNQTIDWNKHVSFASDAKGKGLHTRSFSHPTVGKRNSEFFFADRGDSLTAREWPPAEQMQTAALGGGPHGSWSRGHGGSYGSSSWSRYDDDPALQEYYRDFPRGGKKKKPGVNETGVVSETGGKSVGFDNSSDYAQQLFEESLRRQVEYFDAEANAKKQAEANVKEQELVLWVKPEEDTTEKGDTSWYARHSRLPTGMMRPTPVMFDENKPDPDENIKDPYYLSWHDRKKFPRPPDLYGYGYGDAYPVAQRRMLRRLGGTSASAHPHLHLFYQDTTAHPYSSHGGRAINPYTEGGHPSPYNVSNRLSIRPEQQLKKALLARGGRTMIPHAPTEPNQLIAWQQGNGFCLLQTQ